MGKKTEHVGWTLQGRCREVAASLEDGVIASIIYGETTSIGCWFYTLPDRPSGGSIEEPKTANIDMNGNIIGKDIADAELGKILAESISEDYEMMRTIQEVVRQMELVEDISVKSMIPGKIYGFEEEEYCSLAVSVLSEDRLYFMRLVQDRTDYGFANEEDEKVDCWPMEYLQRLTESKPDDYEYDTRTLRGIYHYASTEIYNMSEMYVDFDKKDFITVTEFAEQVSLRSSYIGKSEEMRTR